MAPFMTIILRNHRFLVILVLAGLLSPAMLPGQAASFGSKMRYGGGLGLSFGRDAYSLNLAPSAIYQANEQFAFGLGASLSRAKFG